jgi:hypothetical protein
MRFYGLSPQKVLGIISKPKRKEEGIVKNTTAVMQPISPKIINNKIVWKQEVWAMYQKNLKSKIPNLKTGQVKIISAWRYPGVSPKKNPIPENILEEIENLSSAQNSDTMNIIL